jgi:hypothetical protein
MIENNNGRKHYISLKLRGVTSFIVRAMVIYLETANTILSEVFGVMSSIVMQGLYPKKDRLTVYDLYKKYAFGNEEEQSFRKQTLNCRLKTLELKTNKTFVDEVSLFLAKYSPRLEESRFFREYVLRIDGSGRANNIRQ